MAKRKRLTPPDPAHLEGAAPSEKTMRFPTYPDGVATRPSRPAPIADVAGDAATVAALEDVTNQLAKARAQGRMVLELPLAAIDLTYLVRDRVLSDPEEMEALKQSLRARGQQNPIEVADLGPEKEGPRYGLISGWRRVTALQALAGEDARFGTVQALLRQPSEASEAYLAMVEENEIRVGLSYFERARIAAKAVEQGVFPTRKKALLALYHAASRSKRSKIRSFLSVVETLDGALRFPAALGERLGLALAKRLEDDPKLGAHLRAVLARADAQTAQAEQKVLQQAIKPPKEAETETKPAEKPVELRKGGPGELVLSGAGVTPALEKALRAFLRDWAE